MVKIFARLCELLSLPALTICCLIEGAAATVVDVSHVGSQSRSLARKTTLNSPDYGTTFKAAAQDPTKYAGGVIPATEPGLPGGLCECGDRA